MQPGMLQYPPPDPGLLAMLTEMGFPGDQAARALSRTHNHNVEAAVQWIMDHGDEPDEPLVPLAVASTSAAEGEAVMGVPSPNARLVVNPAGDLVPAMVTFPDCKVVLVIPLDVQMSPGKLAAQSAHAAVGIYKSMLRSQVVWLPEWEAGGERTIVLQVPTSAELQTLTAQASRLFLPTYMVQDAGRTEVAPGTVTVLAIGGPSSEVDQVTGHLSTLRDTAAADPAAAVPAVPAAAAATTPLEHRLASLSVSTTLVAEHVAPPASE